MSSLSVEYKFLPKSRHRGKDVRGFFVVRYPDDWDEVLESRLAPGRRSAFTNDQFERAFMGRDSVLEVVSGPHPTRREAKTAERSALEAGSVWMPSAATAFGDQEVEVDPAPDPGPVPWEGVSQDPGDAWRQFQEMLGPVRGGSGEA